MFSFYQTWNDKAFFSAQPVWQCHSRKPYEWIPEHWLLPSPTESDEKLLDVLLYGK